MVFGEQLDLEVQEFNPNGVKSALELIGKNISVQAFQENVNVDHTVNLVNLLNERGKAIEAAAAKRQLALVKNDPA